MVTFNRNMVFRYTSLHIESGNIYSPNIVQCTSLIPLVQRRGITGKHKNLNMPGGLGRINLTKQGKLKMSNIVSSYINNLEFVCNHPSASH